MTADQWLPGARERIGGIYPKEAWRNYLKYWTVSDLDCGGGYRGIYMWQTHPTPYLMMVYLFYVNFTSIKLILKEKMEQVGRNKWICGESYVSI